MSPHNPYYISWHGSLTEYFNTLSSKFLSNDVTNDGVGRSMYCHISRRLWTAAPLPMISTPSSLGFAICVHKVRWHLSVKYIYRSLCTYRKGWRASPSLMWACMSSCAKVDTCTSGISKSDNALFKGTHTPWSMPRFVSLAGIPFYATIASQLTIPPISLTLTN
jgi:hypothetical protein